MGWLSAGYVPKSIHLVYKKIIKQLAYKYKELMSQPSCTLSPHGYRAAAIHLKTVLYYVSKWHMDAINTLNCSVFARFFGYQLTVGWLCPKSIHIKTVIYYNVPKVHMAAINTWGFSVFTRMFGYLAGYVQKSKHF